MSSPSHRAADLIVLGGGVIGLASALEAARRGVRVTLLEAGRVGQGATHAAAGMLSPLGEAHDDGSFLDLALRSLRLYPEWVRGIEEASGRRVDYREGGKVRVAHSPEGLRALEARSILARERTLRARWLSPEALHAEVSGLHGSIAKGLLIEDDFRIDNRKLSEALVEAARLAGVAVREGTAAVALVLDGSRVAGIRLMDGSVLQCGALLLAAGAWSNSIEGFPHPVPIRPVRGQMLALSPRHLPTNRVLESEEVYLVPREDGRLLVGATVEEAGFVEANTAEGIAGLLGAALRLLPGLGDAPIVELWSGLRPATPDGNPVLGSDPEIAGLFHATGHFRNGILLAPETARGIADLLTAADTSPFAPDFAPARFRSES